MTGLPLEPGYCAGTELPIVWLRRLLVAGVVVDLSGAAGLFLFPTALTEQLGVAVDNDFWPIYSAVFLVVVPLFYMIGAQDPARYLGNVGGAIVARFLGFLFYTGYFFWPHETPPRPIFLGLGIMNLVFAVAYTWVLGPRGRTCLVAAVRAAHAAP